MCVCRCRLSTTGGTPSVLFPDLFDKPLFAKFNQEQASSDGRAVLLKAAERVYGLVKAFARCLSDKRAPEKIRHTLADLIGQRIFGIACGHPDCNDAEHLADDPIHKLLLGRDPVAGESLSSQPTLSRFENAAGRGALYEMGCELAARVVERHRRRLGRVRRITIDLDPTDDPTHGAQQYSLFNGYYDNWCYLPLLAFLVAEHHDHVSRQDPHGVRLLAPRVPARVMPQGKGPVLRLPHVFHPSSNTVFISSVLASRRRPFPPRWRACVERTRGPQGPSPAGVSAPTSLLPFAWRRNGPHSHRRGISCAMLPDVLHHLKIGVVVHAKSLTAALLAGRLCARVAQTAGTTH